MLLVEILQSWGHVFKHLFLHSCKSKEPHWQPGKSQHRSPSKMYRTAVEKRLCGSKTIESLVLQELYSPSREQVASSVSHGQAPTNTQGRSETQNYNSTVLAPQRAWQISTHLQLHSSPRNTGRPLTGCPEQLPLVQMRAERGTVTLQLFT